MVQIKQRRVVIAPRRPGRGGEMRHQCLRAGRRTRALGPQAPVWASRDDEGAAKTRPARGRAHHHRPRSPYRTWFSPYCPRAGRLHPLLCARPRPALRSAAQRSTGDAGAQRLLSLSGGGLRRPDKWRDRPAMETSDGRPNGAAALTVLPDEAEESAPSSSEQLKQRPRQTRSGPPALPLYLPLHSSQSPLTIHTP